MRIRTKSRTLALRSLPSRENRRLRSPLLASQPAASAVEEPALEERKDFLSRERPGVRLATVPLEHAHVVLERLVGMLERVLELVPLEDDVVGTRLVRLAQLRVDDAPDRPERTGSSLDPENDALLFADVVDSDEKTLRVPTLSRSPSHMPGIQSRSVAVFKNVYSFLFQRSAAEEHVARYVIREHDRGRSLDEILADKYVQNRLTPEQQKRLLDRPEIIEAISGDMLEAAKASLPSGSAA